MPSVEPAYPRFRRGVLHWAQRPTTDLTPGHLLAFLNQVLPMGYAHGWTLHRDLTDSEWSAITQAVQRLADDLPHQVNQGPFVAGHVPTLRERPMVVLWKRSNRPPFRSDPEGQGILGADGRSIVVHPGGPVPRAGQEVFRFYRDAHSNWCKTNAGFYDRLAAGTLVVTQRYARGALTIDTTDMEADHRRSLKAWVREVLAREADRSVREAAALAAEASVPATLGRPATPRR